MGPHISDARPFTGLPDEVQQDLLPQLEICRQPLLPGVLLLVPLEPLGVLVFSLGVPPAPAVIGLIGDARSRGTPAA
jgi:hypothetical protein